MSLYRSPSAALLKSPSQAAFAGAGFGSMSVADLGSLTRLENLNSNFLSSKVRSFLSKPKLRFSKN
ncbi:hypothetical protein CAEBREN_09385 [Caenorhabditis brenneri]|uniref:Uncharacterized protein n=1 Tax=Caenorhabditis brenneri TaxID=135651 RepID=G0P5D6_CAEBE|nr:hypothetical protein CAEBREN_09385 [Caenorhabditis brenneri]